MRIVLIITGSISAYKSAELARELIKRGHSVQPVMSEGAQKFITPLTLQTLTTRTVATNLWSLEEENSIGHIKIADEADLILVAPASANFIAKIACGFAEDICQTIMLATTAPVLICPAMNVNMWNNTATKENIQVLLKRGVKILEPDSGELACGWEGQGRLPELGKIVKAAEDALRDTLPLMGKKIVITAGPTREQIDPMRVITNLSSGKTGVAIAKAASQKGAEVVLLNGPGVSSQLDVRQISYQSALDLQSKLEGVLSEDTTASEVSLIMAAAPADFRPENISATKTNFSKEEAITLKLVPNPDIVKGIAERRADFKKLKNIIAFAAEDVDGLEKKAEKKLIAKKLDFIVANDVQKSVIQDETEFLLIGKDGSKRSSGKLTKSAAGNWLIKELFLS